MPSPYTSTSITAREFFCKPIMHVCYLFLINKKYKKISQTKYADYLP